MPFRPNGLIARFQTLDFFWGQLWGPTLQTSNFGCFQTVGLPTSANLAFTFGISKIFFPGRDMRKQLVIEAKEVGERANVADLRTES